MCFLCCALLFACHDGFVRKIISGQPRSTVCSYHVSASSCPTNMKHKYVDVRVLQITAMRTPAVVASISSSLTLFVSMYIFFWGGYAFLGIEDTFTCSIALCNFLEHLSASLRLCRIVLATTWWHKPDSVAPIRFGSRGGG